MEEEARIRKQIALAKKRKITPPITEEFSCGYRMAADGWTFFVNRAFIKTDDPEKLHTVFLWFEIGEKKHPKEYKSLNQNFTSLNPSEPKPVSYKYGKINNLYPLRLGIGNKKQISGKLDNRTVHLYWSYGAALNIGFLKPYYLDILVPEGNLLIRKVEKYSEENKTFFLDLQNRGTIVGGSNFTKGIAECKIIPGITIKNGIFFDYSASKKSFLGLEIGCSVELYAKEVALMAVAQNRPYFVNVYADFRVGRRWARSLLEEEVVEMDPF